MAVYYDWSTQKYKLNPVPSFNFALEVEAAFFMPLKSVKVFTKENEFEYYQEGGLNDYVHMLRKPISRPFTFQVERYVGVSATTDFNTLFIDPIAMGTELILPVILYVTHQPAGNSGANFSFTNTTRAYIFTGCTVIGKEYGELNAERSGLLTDTTTISYRELLVMNALNPSWEGGEQWEFADSDINANFKGKGKSHDSNKQAGGEHVQPSLWKFASGNINENFKGEGDMHDANKTDGGTPPAPSLWEYDGKTVEGGGESHDANKKPGGPHVRPSQWRFADNEINENFLGAGDMHDQNKRPGGPHVPPSAWEYDGTPQGSGDSHDGNRMPGGTPPAPSVWEYDGSVEGGGTPHDNNKKYGGSPPDPSLWEYDGSVPGRGTPHDANKMPGGEPPTPSVWEYDGTVKGGGDSHDQNKKPGGTPPTASVWPPNRRALMANELMK